jgi:hypothetical protein
MMQNYEPITERLPSNFARVIGIVVAAGLSALLGLFLFTLLRDALFDAGPTAIPVALAIGVFGFLCATLWLLYRFCFTKRRKLTPGAGTAVEWFTVLASILMVYQGFIVSSHFAKVFLFLTGILCFVQNVRMLKRRRAKSDV